MERVEREKNYVAQLIEMLVQSAAGELTVYNYCTTLCVSLNELEGREIREILGVECAQNRKHFESLVRRIYVLGGSLPSSLKNLYNNSACSPVSQPEASRNAEAVFQMLVEAKRRAIRSYTQICSMTAGREHGTYILALKILTHELEHKAWFYRFPGESSPGPLHDKQRLNCCFSK